jgi:hypothetical protein
MLPLDATELYDLPEAARLLFADPARLRRWARQKRVPICRRPEGDGVPRAWVDAETGRVPTDAEAIRRYWLERLAPPSPEAQRAQEDRERLPADRLLDPEAAAREVYADRVRLRRLAEDGTLPALLVDGEVAYDAQLVELAAGAGDGSASDLAARREEVARWSRLAYVTGLHAGAAPPPAIAKPAPRESTAVAPHAWRLPDDLGAEDAPEPDGDAEREAAETDTPEGRRLLEADGFETVDEDP